MGTALSGQVSARTKAGISPDQLRLRWPLVYVGVRSGGRPGWDSSKHPLAELRTRQGVGQARSGHNTTTSH